MDNGEDFDRWWAVQNPKPAVQKGTMRRGWRLGAAAERAACAGLVRTEIGKWSGLSREGVDELLNRLAAAIEARGKEGT